MLDDLIEAIEAKAETDDMHADMLDDMLKLIHAVYKAPAKDVAKLIENELERLADAEDRYSCQFQTYRGSLEEPPEYCEEPVLFGQDYCKHHN